MRLSQDNSEELTDAFEIHRTPIPSVDPYNRERDQGDVATGLTILDNNGKNRSQL